MCGRFTLSKSSEAIASAFQLNEIPQLQPQYNIAPTQPVAVILRKPEDSELQFQQLHWGLIPSWAKDPSMGARLINARAETITEKPAFRSAFRHRRCLVVADGFYEWQRQERKKQPYYFRLQNSQLFAFAGLWERWQSPDGEEIQSCTILTTEANDLVRNTHDRMPVILDSKDYDLWLDAAVQNTEPLQQLLRSYQSEAMTSYAVSTKVNNPANNTPECINSL